MANLEDSVTALERRHTRFQDTYSAYLAKRDHYREVIETFDDDLMHAKWIAAHIWSMASSVSIWRVATR